MEASRNLAKGPLATATLVWAPWVVWELVKAYMLGQGDSKFGAEGGVMFVAAIWGLMAIVAAVTFFAILLSWQAVRSPLDNLAFWASVLGSGVVLSVLSRFVFLLPPIGSTVFGDIGGVVASWVIVCIIVQFAGVGLASSIAT